VAEKPLRPVAIRPSLFLRMPSAKAIDRSLCEISHDRRPKNPRIFMDDDVIGFGVLVWESDRKSLTLDYRFEGRRRRLYIADFADRLTSAVRNPDHSSGRQRPRGARNAKLLRESDRNGTQLPFGRCECPTLE